jgi:carboxyl-terminal processing protease
MQRWLLLSLVLLNGCATLDPNNLIGRRVSPTPNHVGALTPAIRQQAFEQVSQTIADKYVDAKHNGVDWQAVVSGHKADILASKTDTDFWLALDQLAGVLKDAHTRVESPERVAERVNQKGNAFGISLIRIDEQVLIRSVHPESDAYWTGVRIGMQVTHLGKEPITTLLEAALSKVRDSSTPVAKERRALRDLLPAGDSLNLSLKRQDGSTFSTTLNAKANSYKDFVDSRVLPGNIGYLRWTAFDLSLQNELLEKLSTLRATKGLIIDLRGNGGGAMLMVNNLVEQLYTKPTQLLNIYTRNNQPMKLMGMSLFPLQAATKGNPAAYQNPIVVLLNDSSASASEAFAAALQDSGRAKVVGRVSCGCLLGFMGYLKLAGGGEMAYSEIGFTTIKGNRIEGRGVLPDVAVPLTAADLMLNRDRALELALGMF